MVGPAISKSWMNCVQSTRRRADCVLNVWCLHHSAVHVLLARYWCAYQQARYPWQSRTQTGRRRIYRSKADGSVAGADQRSFYWNTFVSDSPPSFRKMVLRLSLLSGLFGLRAVGGFIPPVHITPPLYMPSSGHFSPWQVFLLWSRRSKFGLRLQKKQPEDSEHQNFVSYRLCGENLQFSPTALLPCSA